MTKVRLYLDVDGVLNAGAPAWTPVQTGRATAGNGEWTIRWGPKLIEALRELDVELVWATTWRGDAKNIAKLVGWPEAEDARFLDGENSFRERNSFSINWKTHALVADQEADPAPFIWIDDELREEGYARSYHSIDDRVAHLGNYLIIGPNDTYGITPEHIEQMKAFIEAHR